MRESWANYHKANKNKGNWQFPSEEMIGDLDLDGHGTGAFSRYAPDFAGPEPGTPVFTTIHD